MIPYFKLRPLEIYCLYDLLPPLCIWLSVFLTCVIQSLYWDGEDSLFCWTALDLQIKNRGTWKGNYITILWHILLFLLWALNFGLKTFWCVVGEVLMVLCSNHNSLGRL
jgi:hypothetical protein